MCVHSMWVCRLKELSREVESHIQRVRISASRRLTERRTLAVAEVELKHVSARPLLDTEGEARVARVVARNPWRCFGDDVDRRRQSQPAAHADVKRVAIDVEDRRCVVHPYRCRIQ